MQRDKASVLDIIYAIERILSYTSGMSYERFAVNEEKQDAVLRRITIIGEATKRISAEFREVHSHIAWREMAGMRDIVVHNYDQLKVQVVWDVVQNDLSHLLTQLQCIVTENSL
jgi:uncharacterized protein with HEPN domain